MAAYVLQRLLWAVLTFVGITVLTLGLLRLAPGDALLSAAGDVQGGAATTEQTEAVRRIYRLDQPWWAQYGQWVERLIRFDLGRSFVDQRLVREKLWEALPTTVALMGSAWVLALLFAVPLGVLSAARSGSVLDRALMLLSSALAASPPFFLGVGLLMLLASPRGLGLFPLQAGGGFDGPLGALGIFERVWRLTLPVLCLSLGLWAVAFRQVRTQLRSTLALDFVRTAHAKGLPERWILWRHALRPALLPLLTWVGLWLPHLVGGSVVVEQVFGLPGMGLLAFDALLARDTPTVMGVTSALAVLTLGATLAVDLTAAAVDPRLHLGGERP